LGMPFVSQEERPYGDVLLAFSYHVVLAHDGRLGFVSASSISGSRLHHWLPTSPGCPCILRDEVLSLYPTTGSAFPMDVGQSVTGCAVRVIRRLGRFFEGTSKNQLYATFE
jgi:hypothetical protein